MELQKVNVKFFMAEANTVPLTDFIDLFHGWIQAGDGVYLDVADYSHMQAGPGIVLVAGDANVSIDETGNRRGLLYNYKNHLYGSNNERLRGTVKSALENCMRLEDEPSLGGKVRFLGNELSVSVNDRLVAPNSEESFREIENEIVSFARDLYGDSEIRLERDTDPRRTFSIRIKAACALNLKELRQRLQKNQGEGEERDNDVRRTTFS
ncbi:MAG: hypothetical protein ACREQ7_15635 [Candidatus Binatia bacterium]